MLERLGLTGADLAERLGVPTALVEDRLASSTRAPLVMLDGEDAIAPGDAVADRASAVAAETLAEADWGAGGAATLRFYRPPGFNLETTARDLYTLLWRLRERVPSGPFPLDGIVFPKVEHPEEVDLLDGILTRAETDLGLDRRSIRVGLLIESGLGGRAARGDRRPCRAATREPHLRRRGLQRRPRAPRDRQRPPARRLGPRGDHRRGGRRSACPPSTA